MNTERLYLFIMSLSLAAVLFAVNLHGRDGWAKLVTWTVGWLLSAVALVCVIAQGLEMLE